MYIGKNIPSSHGAYIGVSNNSGTPKWMVYNGKPYKKWMIWGENRLFSETSIWGHASVDMSFFPPARKQFSSSSLDPTFQGLEVRGNPMSLPFILHVRLCPANR